MSQRQKSAKDKNQPKTKISQRQKSAKDMNQPSELAPIVSENPLKKLDLLFFGLPARDAKRAVVVDVSVCHHNNAGVNNDTPLASAELRHKEKVAHYAMECNNMAFDLRTLIVETTGARHQGTNDFIAMATANSHSTQGSSAEFTKLTNAIAVAVVQSIANKFDNALGGFQPHRVRPKGKGKGKRRSSFSYRK
jgi:hypothetical protein